MKTLLLTLATVGLLFIGGCFLFAPGPPALTTYSMDLEIELNNDCDGQLASNPTPLQVQAKLFYDNDTINAARSWTVNVAMVPQAGTVMSKGSHTFTDVPTNLTGWAWDFTFPDACSLITCPPGSACKNFGTNVPPPVKITKANESYKYRYSCTCN